MNRRNKSRPLPPSDIERIDWLEKNPNRVKWGQRAFHQPGAWYYTDSAGNLVEARGLRTAIDKARAATIKLGA